MNQVTKPGQGQVPMGNRPQPETPVSTPDSEEQELANVRPGNESSKQQDDAKRRTGGSSERNIPSTQVE